MLLSVYSSFRIYFPDCHCHVDPTVTVLRSAPPFWTVFIPSLLTRPFNEDSLSLTNIVFSFGPIPRTIGIGLRYPEAPASTVTGPYSSLNSSRRMGLAASSYDLSALHHIASCRYVFFLPRLLAQNFDRTNRNMIIIHYSYIEFPRI